MVQARASGGVHRLKRRWSFADCVFDEANWSLTVGGERVRIESKPLELLRALLLEVGSVVSKDELLDSIWGDVTVVEASLPTAVRKLRVAINDGNEGRHFIETVAGIGYRFAAPAELQELDGNGGDGDSRKIGGLSNARTSRAELGATHWPSRAIPLAIFAALAMVAIAVWAIQHRSNSVIKPKATYTTREVKNVMRKLDVDKAEAMIAAGWQPDTPLDAVGDTALGFAVEICEWDPGHDQRRLMLMVRTLLDGGATLDHRNGFGDTAYSIAKAPRYCGSNHPVTRMFRRMCSEGPRPLGDRCMASYELASGQHFVPLPKPAG